MTMVRREQTGTMGNRGMSRNERARTGVLRLVLLAGTLVSGCATTKPSSPYSTPPLGARNTLAAQELNGEAVKSLDQNDLEGAKTLLERALSEDIWFGPAHNNLGVVHLKSNRLYEAANEFEWARKLMPGHPDPRMNLGLVLEKASRIDDAVAAYRSALEVYSEHIKAKEALAKLEVESGRANSKTRSLLEDIVQRGESEEWREWAKKKILWIDGRESK